MIKSIIQHEFNLKLLKRNSWFLLAIIYLVMGLIFNWLMFNYVEAKSNITIVNYGVTEEVIHPYYAWFCLLILACIPTLTTESICNEKNQGTMLNYYCSSINSWQLIFAKFLSLNIMLIALILFTSLPPLVTTLSGSLDWGQFFSNILGVYLMLSTAIAIGIFISACMRNVAKCNVAIFLGLLFAIIIEWAAEFAGGAGIILQKLSLFYHLKFFLNGSLSLQGFSYYLLTSALFLTMGGYKLKIKEI